MLLLNNTLIKLSKGIRPWIILISLLKLVILVGTTMFATSISSLLGGFFNPTGMDLRSQIARAFIASLIMLAGNILVGEAEYRCSAKSRRYMRDRIMGKVMNLDVNDVDRLGITNTINAASDGVETMQTYYTRYLPGLIYGFFAPIYTFFALKDRCLIAAVILLCTALIILPLNNIFKVIIERLKTGYWRDLNDLTAYYMEGLNSMTTTELLGRGKDREDNLSKKANKLSDTIKGVMRINFSAVCFDEFMMNLATFAALVIVCLQLVHGQISLVSALASFMLSYSFFGSIRQLQWIAHEALLGIGAAQNVANILDIDTERIHKEDREKHNDFDGIRIEDISFAYKGRSDVLKNVNLDIQRGKTTAIVGESGCGKSTLAQILLRFYDTEKGHIYLEGHDYLSIDPIDLRKRIIMVPQSVYVFTGSIKENLLMAKPDAADEELWKVLEDVKLKAWVEEQADGLNAFAGEAGARLSGGQRQKIGIARALLSNAEYIIFDEATSSVDEKSEQEIWECIRELASKRTLIIISHRLSTIKDADCIYVLEDGRIAESGNHESLMKNERTYRKLVEEQNELEEMGRRRRNI